MKINRTSFNLIIVTTVTLLYFFSLSMLLKELVESCITELFFNETSRGVWRVIWNEPKFYTYVFAIVSVFYLITKIIISVAVFVFSLIKTNLFLQSLEILERKKYILFKSNKKHAFTAGFLRPKTYISSKLEDTVSTKVLNKIIQHEKYHKRNYDPLKQLLFSTLFNMLPPVFFKEQIINEFLKETEHLAKIDLSILFRIDRMGKSLAVSNYGGNLENEILKVNSFYSNWFGVLMLGLTFIFTSAISLFMTTDPLSACSNHETCALIHNIEPVNKLPAQCVETLYSPVNVKQSSVIRF